MSRTSRTDPQTNIRVPGDLKSRLAEAAKQNGRTINAEIVQRLERSFGGAGPQSLPGDPNALLTELLDKVRALYHANVSPGPPPRWPLGKDKKKPATGDDR